MNHPFKPGDAVKLKVNNLHMIVKSIAIIPSEQESVTTNERYNCIWYDNAKIQQGIFSKDLLEWLAPDYDTLHFANYE